VELALLLPVVALLLLAVLQVGLLARDAVLVTHAAREAARAAAVEPSVAAAREAAERAGGLAADRLEVTTRADGRARHVTVTVTYRAPAAVPIVGALVGERTLRAAATMRTEYDP
jgi:Flp pilus assembly protein TadG